MKTNKIEYISIGQAEEVEMIRLKGIMTGIGMCAGAVVVFCLVALMIYNLNWWVVPALISAVATGGLLKIYFKDAA